MNKMMFKFDEEKAVSAVKLILLNMSGECNFHKLFKILYFADQKHLTTYGFPISGDSYVAMKDGPVPSAVYDMLKIIKGESRYYRPELQEAFSKFFTVNGRNVSLADQTVDPDIFSESEIECLLAAVEENKLLSYGALVDKSHDSAWHNASRNQAIQTLDMAKAGGANEELLKYITLNIENEHLHIK